MLQAITTHSLTTPPPSPDLSAFRRATDARFMRQPAFHASVRQPDLVEAYVRAGTIEHADESLATLQRQAETRRGTGKGRRGRRRRHARHERHDVASG
jgi:hypothetical protein